MSKTILGLDLGTSSIGWALIKEANLENEISSIEKIGVRVNPLTADEQTNFEKGKPITTNANRTLGRSARRNLQRYKLRRSELIEILKENRWIDDESILCEISNHSTFETYRLRAQSCVSKISLVEFARVLLMINKKRGYRSSRKVNNTEEGQLIDGMAIAKQLYNDNLTPGQFVYNLLKEGKRKVPDFYRSDLYNELEIIWDFQKVFYEEIMTDTLYESISNKGKVQTWASLKTPFELVGIKRDKKRDELRLENYRWRTQALTEKLSLEQLAIVLQEVNGQLYNSSGYLGAISDRSKELYFNQETVGQYLYKKLQDNTHFRLKNQVFYRQDYLDEFEKLWEVQSQFHKELTPLLKTKIRDVIIFYQRKLKSQKGLISFCEFEQREVTIDGKTTTIGSRVAHRSSLLFQEFKIWQQLHNVRLRNKNTKEIVELSEEAKEVLFDELNVKGKLSAAKVLKLLDNGRSYELNYTELDGNTTNAALYEKFLEIIDIEGYDVRDELRIKLNKDDISIVDLDISALDIKEMIIRIFKILNIDTTILIFDGELENKAFENQQSYQLWHLLHSYEEDDSTTGMDTLYRLLHEKFNFSIEQSKILGSVVLSRDYGSLSSKAIRNIFPFIKSNEYSKACALAGYRHSKESLTTEEISSRVIKDRLTVLPKNSLRNPVVEKIINQMVNVINTLIDTENDKLEKVGLPRSFKFDEIRVELARDLKKNAKERAELTKQINTGKSVHEAIVKILQREDGVENPTRNDIIRYKLYQELKNNGYKNLYTQEYVERKDLFSNKYDIDHIIPQSRLFDDSFSNKTLCPREINIKKGSKTAYDFILDAYGQDKANLFETRIKNLGELKEEGISKAKCQKLLMRGKDIGEGFIQRDLRDSQYIAKKAKAMLLEITPVVVTTSGAITDRLRNDWGLVNVMKELNLPKYRAMDRTQIMEIKGAKKEIILDWTKRNDHRHHAMDALTIAFTKRSFIQYLNNLNARKEENQTISNTNRRNSLEINDLKISTKEVLGIQQKETIKIKDEQGHSKRVFKEPIPHFRHVAKELLDQVLVSHKAKNKVVTKNKNRVNGSGKMQETLTPRGQLHKETVYGKIKQYISKAEKISSKFDEKTIEKVSNPHYRALLLERLNAFGNNPKLAFSGKNTLIKNPIYIDSSEQETIPEKVKLIWLEDNYTIRKDVGPDLKIDKVIDQGVKRILQSRLDEYGGDVKKAFSNLDQDPIWLNKEKGIAIKRVKISGVNNVEVLHTKKDHLGKIILDTDNNPIPVDFVSTGNNHHVAIYANEKGNLEERVVSFFEAVTRVNEGLPIIDKVFNQHLGWKFMFTMKQNEMFLFPAEDFNPREVDLFNRANYKVISKHLFRVQKFTIRDYFFRHHLETNVEDLTTTKGITWRREGLAGIKDILKVRTNHLGEIIQINEY